MADIPMGNSEDRARMTLAIGAEVVLIDQAPGSLPRQTSGEDLERVDQAARRITQDHEAFRADQFHRDGNWLAHYLTTAPKLWQQSGGTVDEFGDFIGSGGTYAGLTRALQERRP